MKDIKEYIVNESNKCPYCDINNKEVNSLDGKYLPNCGGDRDFSTVYQDWDDEGTTKHLLICDGRRGGYYRPKYCPECGRKLEN